MEVAELKDWAAMANELGATADERAAAANMAAMI